MKVTGWSSMLIDIKYLHVVAPATATLTLYVYFAKNSRKKRVPATFHGLRAPSGKIRRGGSGVLSPGGEIAAQGETSPTPPCPIPARILFVQIRNLVLMKKFCKPLVGNEQATNGRLEFLTDIGPKAFGRHLEHDGMRFERHDDFAKRNKIFQALRHTALNEKQMPWCAQIAALGGIEMSPEISA